MDDLDNGNPAKSSQNGSAGNFDPLPSGYSRGTCDECVEIVFKTGHKHSKQKKTVNRNWGLLLYLKRADPGEVREIEDKVIEYLNEVASESHSRKQKTCFVCGRQARGLNHNVKDCIQIVDVLCNWMGSCNTLKEQGDL